MAYVIFKGELHEMTLRQIRETGARIVSTKQAHEWVRKGEVHNTALWIDDSGRIRRAVSNQ